MPDDGCLPYFLLMKRCNSFDYKTLSGRHFYVCKVHLVEILPLLFGPPCITKKNVPYKYANLQIVPTKGLNYLPHVCLNCYNFNIYQSLIYNKQFPRTTFLFLKIIFYG